MHFDKFFREVIFGPKPVSSLESPFEWDIFLTTVNDIKSAFRKEPLIEDSAKKRLLMHNMPRFVWRAIMRHKNSAVLELLFDATDIEQGKFFVHGVKYDDNTYSLLRLVSRNALSDTYFQTKPYWRILEWFATKG